MEYKGKKLIEGDINLNLYPYKPDEDLVNAVNIAIYLNRPLLVRGRPGTGKSLLAESIAYDIYTEQYQRYLFKWKIKSTSKTSDGLYTYDHLKRLRDAQIPSNAITENKKDIENHSRYLKFGPLGQAFLLGSIPGNMHRPILLIDEIDKADIDFPNDLLSEIDEKKFVIDEIDEEVKGKPLKITLRGKDVEIKKEINAQLVNPIIIITSNDERELSDAFLRRCVFYYIDLPTEKKLLEIVEGHLKFELKRSGNDRNNSINNIIQYIKPLVNSFYSLQNEMLNKEMNKIPTTSEVLDFVKSVAYLHAQGKIPKDKLKEVNPRNLPYISTLIKTAEDWEHFKDKLKQ